MKIITFLRSLLVKNWLAKLVCLLFAVGLWAWVVVQQTTERSFSVEIDFHEIPEEHVLGENTDREVRISLQGPQALVNTLEADDLAVDVNLSGLSAGEERIQILPWHVHNPDGTSVSEIDPRSVQVSLVERVSKIVTVQPGLTGERVERFEYEINVEPDTAQVTGPRGEVEALSELYLTRLDLPEPGDPPVEATVEAVLPRGVQLESPAQNAFQVRIDVSETEKEQTIENVPIKVPGLGEGENVDLSPETVKVRISGPVSLVEGLAPGDIVATVEPPEARADFQLKRVEFSLPEGLELADESAAEKTVRVEWVEP